MSKNWNPRDIAIRTQKSYESSAPPLVTGDNPLEDIEKLPDFTKAVPKPKIKVKIAFKATTEEDIVSDSDSEGLPPVMNQPSDPVLGFLFQTFFLIGSFGCHLVTHGAWLIIWSLIESSNSSGEPIQNPIRTSLTLARKKKRLFDDPEPEDDPKGKSKPKIRPTKPGPQTY